MESGKWRVGGVITGDLRLVCKYCLILKKVDRSGEELLNMVYRFQGFTDFGLHFFLFSGYRLSAGFDFKVVFLDRSLKIAAKMRPDMVVGINRLCYGFNSLVIGFKSLV